MVKFMQTQRFYFRFSIIIIFITIINIRLYYLENTKKSFYQEQYDLKSNNIIEGYSAPRGRIIDRNGIVLVDNYSINIITYRKVSNVSEIDLAFQILNKINYSKYASKEEIIEFHLNTMPPLNYLTATEKELYQERKITRDEIKEIQRNRISKEELDQYNQEYQKAISIYNLMNKGYSYETKIIKNENVSNNECANIIEANIPGVTCELSWKRTPVYEDLSPIYGSISQIPREEKDYYLDLGYNLNDLVGISYLEKQYDQYLQGTKTLYSVNNDNTLEIYKEGSRGNDLQLSIDIKLVQEINQIIKNNLLKSTQLKKTDYFNSAYVIVSSPSTGNILSLNGIRILKDGNDYTFKEVTPNIINTSYTMGSVIKGASMTVGYLNNLINPNQKIYDSCVKLHFVPAKCSHKPLGWLDDISALQTSSNYYQFLLAIGLTGKKYSYNMELNATSQHFDIYRQTFAKFGLGSKTGIDLPNETTGITGNIIADDLLLNLAIGQYDTYTPIALSQYINTIASNGKRLKMNLVSKVLDNQGNIILNNEPTILSTIKDTGYFDRIKEGMRQVLDGGTGRGYVDPKYNPAGKTGTSETYYDKTTTTITQTFAMFAPVNNPKYSIIVITPNVSYNTPEVDEKYIAPINRYISKEVSKLVFENY